MISLLRNLEVEQRSQEWAAEHCFKLNRDDPRKMLELHHKQQHKDGGENTVENLITLCNVCHDAIHRQKG
ncbi:MAG: HNH endonuclease [Oscillospiraceae bacterium]